MKSKQLAMCFALSLALCVGCGEDTTSHEEDTPTGGATEGQTKPEPSPEEESPPEEFDRGENPVINLALYGENSQVGGVGLLLNNESGETLNSYHITLSDNNYEVKMGLISGEIDIASLPSCQAVKLYHESDGGIQVVGIDGLGGYYILEDSHSVISLADLTDFSRNVYTMGEGEDVEYLLEYLFVENGVDGSQVPLQWRTTEDTVALLAGGGGDLGLLPALSAMEVMAENSNVREALSLSFEWSDLRNGASLVTSVLVVNTQFAQDYPQSVTDFLTDYQSSLDYVTSGDPSVGEEMVEMGLASDAIIANAAIPNCDLTLITGTNQLIGMLQGYYEKLWQTNPQFIGGGLPDDGFYYSP